MNNTGGLRPEVLDLVSVPLILGGGLEEALSPSLTCIDPGNLDPGRPLHLTLSFKPSSPMLPDCSSRISGP